MSGSGTDIALTWNPATGRGDWTVTNGDLTKGQALETAVLVSLFTDAEATPDFRTDDPRGHWSDVYEDDPYGSNFWEMEREKKTDQVTLLLRAKGYAQRCLKWLIEDGVAATVVVRTSWLTPSTMLIAIDITEPDGTDHNFAYPWAWQGVTS